MKYSIYSISYTMTDANSFIMTVCNFLRAKVSFSDVEFWIYHLGDAESWGSYWFDDETFHRNFDVAFPGSVPPKVHCLHMEGYRSFEEAAEMCYNVIRADGQKRAIFFDMDNNFLGITSVACSLMAQLRADGRNLGCVLFSTQDELMNECREDIIDSEVTSIGCIKVHTVLRNRLYRALELME